MGRRRTGNTRRSSKPLSSYLLRVAEVRVERTVLAYELHELGTGAVHRFDSLAGLQRFLAAAAPATRRARRPD